MSASSHTTIAWTAYERNAFYRAQVGVSFNTTAPGVVGSINKKFQELSDLCIEGMPIDRHSVHGDEKLKLALQLIEMAKDAAVKAVILTRAVDPPTHTHTDSSSNGAASHRQ